MFNKKNFINFYGRRKGRIKASNYDLLENLLPLYQIKEDFFISNNEKKSDFENYSSKFSEVHFEIGCGSGDFIFQQAKNNPKILYIAAEVFMTAIGSLLKKLEDYKLDNLKIYNNNVYNLFNILPYNSLNYIYILFPDPWRKTKHHKRRMINKSNLDIFYNILQPNGSIRFVSDHYDYVSWTLNHFLQDPRYNWLAAKVEDFLEPPENHVKTKYESKALEKGLQITYLTFNSLKKQ